MSYFLHQCNCNIIFGGKPDLFFGYQEIISRFQLKLADYDSDYRAWDEHPDADAS
jgi:hypothetical protein